MESKGEEEASRPWGLTRTKANSTNGATEAEPEVDDASAVDDATKPSEEPQEDGDAPDGDAEGDDGDRLSGCEEIEWEEFYACPLNVRFTQEKIHPFFYRRGPIVNVVPKIRPVLHYKGDCDEEVCELVPPFAPIHCLRKGTELWSLDNRRLYALQLAAMEQWPLQCSVRLLCRDKLPRHKFKSQYRKFNTTSEGRTIDVCARYQQFDTWNWFDRAVEIEWFYFSQRLGTVLSIFEIAPVVCALLFRTGLTGFSSRVPLIIGFVVTFAMDLLRQKIPSMEKRICEIHVRSVMDGEVRRLCPCLNRVSQDRRSGAVGAFRAAREATSTAQLGAVMALVLLLILPYLLGLSYGRLRSSLISCWLGVACVLVVQLGEALRSRSSDGATAGLALSGSLLSPKHRD